MQNNSMQIELPPNLLEGTVVRPALWICGGKHCSFHITSLPSDCEDWITCSRQFFTETEGNNIHISEFYPQSLREKTLRTLVCPQCPQITTVHCHFEYIKKHIIIPRNCCFSTIPLCSIFIFYWNRHFNHCAN